MTLTNESIPIEVHLRADDWADLVRQDAVAGLHAVGVALKPLAQ